MPRQKKQRLKQRPDGRYLCRYKSQWFYGVTEEDALAQREEYKRIEALGLVATPTLQQFADGWITRAYPSVAPSTLVGLKIHLRKLTDAIGSELITDIRPSQIKQVFSEKYLGLSNSYILAGRQLFVALFDAAVSDGYRTSNPAREKAAKPHQGTFGGHRQITDQERVWIETLCTDHRAHAAAMAMLWAGIRPQEAKALRIDRDVDFAAETINLHAFAHLDGQRYKITRKGKTKKAARMIPLFPPLREALQGKKGDLITNSNGSPVTIQGWKCVWKSYVFHMETAINGCQKRWYGKTREHKAILAAGGHLPPWVSFTVVPYDLRHSFCCWCRDNGVEMNTCIRWMGHADATMILKIYDEANDRRSEREAARLKKTAFGSQKNRKTADS